MNYKNIPIIFDKNGITKIKEEVEAKIEMTLEELNIYIRTNENINIKYNIEEVTKGYRCIGDLYYGDKLIKHYDNIDELFLEIYNLELNVLLKNMNNHEMSNKDIENNLSRFYEIPVTVGDENINQIENEMGEFGVKLYQKYYDWYKVHGKYEIYDFIDSFCYGKTEEIKSYLDEIIEDINKNNNSQRNSMVSEIESDKGKIVEYENKMKRNEFKLYEQLTPLQKTYLNSFQIINSIEVVPEKKLSQAEKEMLFDIINEVILYDSEHISVSYIADEIVRAYAEEKVSLEKLENIEKSDLLDYIVTVGALELFAEDDIDEEIE